MRVFLTGATGFIGSAIVKELIAAGHQVAGLSRSKEKAEALSAAGATVVQGTVEDFDLLKRSAGEADGVIHTAFNHDFSRFAQNCEDDRKVIEVLGAALAGSDRPLVVTSGTAIANIAPGQVAEEDSPAMTSDMMPRAASEEAAASAARQGTNVSVVRLPQVHDPRRQGLISPAIEMARESGAFAYVGDGGNRWPAAHVLDVAALYRLALERATPDAIYNAVAEEGVAMRDIADVVGKRLGLRVESIAPEEAEARLGWLARFATHDMPASSRKTREWLGWNPKGPDLLSDLARLDLS